MPEVGHREAIKYNASKNSLHGVLITAARKVVTGLLVTNLVLTACGPQIPAQGKVVSPVSPTSMVTEQHDGNAPTPDHLPTKPSSSEGPKEGELFCAVLDEAINNLSVKGDGPLSFSPNAIVALGSENVKSIEELAIRYDQVVSPECTLDKNGVVIVLEPPGSPYGEHVLASVSNAAIRCEPSVLEQVPIEMNVDRIRELARIRGLNENELLKAAVAHELGHTCRVDWYPYLTELDLVDALALTGGEEMFDILTPPKPKSVYTIGYDVIGITPYLFGDDRVTYSNVFGELRADFIALAVLNEFDISAYSTLSDIPLSKVDKSVYYSLLLALDLTLKMHGYEVPPSDLMNIFIYSFSEDDPITEMANYLNGYATDRAIGKDAKAVLVSFALANATMGGPALNKLEYLTIEDEFFRPSLPTWHTVPEEISVR